MTEELTVRLLGESAAAQLPPVIWNEEEVSAALAEMLSAYQGRQYTADELQAARSDRAAVNRIEKQLAEAQKQVTALYQRPVADFADKMKQYRARAKQVSAAIDLQVKAVEQAAREDKREQFRAVYAGAVGGELAALIPFERLLDEHWLNATAPFGPARTELLTRIETCRAELEMLRQLAGEDFPAVQRVYLQSLSIREAQAEYIRITQTRQAQQRAEQARRAEEAARAAAPVILRPTGEQQEIAAAGAQRAQANQHITEDGRLDFTMQRFAAGQTAAQPRPYDLRIWMTDAQRAAFRAWLRGQGIRYEAAPTHN